MTLKKKLIIFIPAIVAAYYIIGFPLTLLGVTKSWPLFPGGISLKYEGANSSEYADDPVPAGTDGPYVFYKGDSLEVIRVTGKDSTGIPVFDSFHKKDKEQIRIACTFEDNPEWSFETRLKDTLINEATVYSDVKRIMVISDIEGNFKSFRELLIANGVMDSSYGWTFSEGHLVLLGDFFDRGLNVTECLWLIYDLEEKAKMKGGYVHFVLGNHEIMNMTDDIRYVRKKYILNGEIIGRPYQEFYNTDSELGKWLSTKNVVEKINGTIFVHGGISRTVLDMKITLEEINKVSRPYYFTSRNDLPEKKNVKNLFSTKDSPHWNRDYVDQRVKEDFVDQVLTAFTSKEIIVGHTLVDQVKAFYSGKVIAVDTQHTERNSYGLLIDGAEYFAVDRSGQRSRVK